MKILCRIENEESQGWSLAFSRVGHTFSFYDGHTPMHNVCHLFKPDMYICNNRYLNRSMQNACAKYKTVIVNVDKHREKIPICANTILYNKYPAKQHDGTLLVFGEPNEKYISLVNSLSRIIKTKIFHHTRWPLNEYCGFVEQPEFLNLVNKSFGCLVVGDTLGASHLNVCAAGGSLFTTCKSEFGSIVNNVEDLMLLMNDRLLLYKRIEDYNNVRINRPITNVISPFLEIYEEENFFLD